MQKNRDNNLWLTKLPKPYCDYVSYTLIEQGRHPSAFLVFAEYELFVKKVPLDNQKIEYQVLEWLQACYLKLESKAVTPSELTLPFPQSVGDKTDIVITSKLDGMTPTKNVLLLKLSGLCKVLTYVHQLVEQADSLNFLTTAVGLPLTASSVDQKYHSLFINAKNNIENSDVLLSVVHGDLSSGNILLSETKIGLVDWEYCHIRDGRWDLATIAVEFEFNENELERLCKEYQQQRGTTEQNFLEVTKSWMVIYALTCLSWATQHNQETNRYTHFLTQLKN